MIKIISAQTGKTVPAWPDNNYYGDEPSQYIKDFCGEEVINELDKVVLGESIRSHKVWFERNNVKYHIHKGINTSKSKSGKFGWNVYRYV